MGERRSIPIARPSTGEEECRAVREPILDGWLTQGPRVQAFEAAFAERHSVPHAIATSNCTTALHLILTAMGIGPGDEVLVPAFTWVATANVVLYCGATPVFVDVDRVTYNLDPAAVAGKVTAQTRAIIAVHLFGLCADIEAIAAAAPRVPIIEDAACAVGATYRGRSAGSLGIAGAFSFHPRKCLTTGEGGMVTTSDARLAQTIRVLRNHGADVSEEERHQGPRPYLLPDFNLLGYNYRMTDLQGAVGLVQLRKLEGFWNERERGARCYATALAGLPWLRPPETPAGWRHGWQAYVCTVDPERAPMPRNTMMEQLQALGVSTRPGTHAVHCLGLYRQRFGFTPESFPVARDCDRQTLTLPLYNGMSPDDYAYVVDALKGLA